MFADTHCHLLDECFNGIRENIISNFDNDGVAFAIENATSIYDSHLADQLSLSNSKIFAAVGIHPECVADYSNSMNSEIMDLATKNKKIIAVGEIGLDYHYDNTSRKDQISLFENMLALASDLKLPVIIHSRDAAQDTFDILNGCDISGVLHCFSGSLEMAEKYIENGFYLGFGGVVTFKNAKKSRQLIECVPLNRILTETDCPYMTPEPFRGTENQPKYIKYVIEKIAEIKNLPKEDIEKTTLNNAKILFGIGEYF